MAKRIQSEQHLQDYLLGIYPVSLRSPREYKTRFYLYFQKNLQIISRYETPGEQLRKQEVLMFDGPREVQPFRAQTDKIMDYKWSLYIKRMDVPGNNEEYVEQLPVDLKKEWENFQQSKQNKVKKMVQFPKMKIKFTFLLIFAHNHQQLQEKTFKYFGLPTSELKVEPNLIKPRRSILDLTNQIITQEKDQRNKLEKEKSIEKKNEPVYERMFPIKKISEVNSCEEQSPNKRSSLTPSDMDFGNEIEQKINSLEQQFQQNFSSKIEEEDETESKTATIRMTNSYIIDKGEPVIQTKSSSAFRIVFIIAVLIVGVLLFKFYDSGSQKQERIRKRKVEKKKAREAEKSKKNKSAKANRADL